MTSRKQELIRNSVYLPLNTVMSDSAKSGTHTLSEHLHSGIDEGFQEITCTQSNVMLYGFKTHDRVYITVHTERMRSLLQGTILPCKQLFTCEYLSLPQDAISLLKEIEKAQIQDSIDFLSNAVHQKSQKIGLGDLSGEALVSLVALEGDVYNSHKALAYKAADVHSASTLEEIIDLAGTYNYKDGMIFLIDSYGRAYLGKSDEVLDEVIKCSYSRTFYSVPFAEYTDADCAGKLEDGYFKDSLRKLIRDIHASK